MRGTKSGFDVRSKGTSGAINSRKNLCLHDNHYSLSPPRYLVHYFTRRSRENGFLAAKSFVGGLRLAREALACEDSAKRAHETNVDDDE